MPRAAGCEQHANFPGLIWPTWKSKRQGEKVIVTNNAIETGRNNGVKKK